MNGSLMDNSIGVPMRQNSNLSVIHILGNMGASHTLLVNNLIDGKASRIMTSSDQDAFLQRCNISQELFEKAVALSEKLRLEDSINSAIWGKLQARSHEFGCPSWVQSVFRLPFSEVSRSINGGGDFIWRDFEIRSQKEKISTETIKAMRASNIGLLQVAKDLSSSRLELLYSMQSTLLEEFIGRESLYVYIQQRINKPMSSSLNWLYIEILMPEEELLFCTSNQDLRIIEEV